MTALIALITVRSYCAVLLEIETMSLAGTLIRTIIRGNPPKF